MNMRSGYGIMKAAVADFLDDNAMALGASLAFYSALSLAPLLVILISATPLLVYIVLFALIYKVLPDVKISWRDVWAGATMTAALFVVGRFLLGLYLGRSSVTSAYGAAGSLVVLLRTQSLGCRNLANAHRVDVRWTSWEDVPGVAWL